MTRRQFEESVSLLWKDIADGGYESVTETEIKKMIGSAPGKTDSVTLEKALCILLTRADETNNDREYAYLARMLFALELALEHPQAEMLEAVDCMEGHHLDRGSMMAIDRGILIEQRAMSSYTWKVFFGFMIPTTFLLLLCLFVFRRPVLGGILFVLLTVINYLFSGQKARKNYGVYRNQEYLEAVSRDVLLFCNQYIRSDDLLRQEKVLRSGGDMR